MGVSSGRSSRDWPTQCSSTYYDFFQPTWWILYGSWDPRFLWGLATALLPVREERASASISGTTSVHEGPTSECFATVSEGPQWTSTSNTHQWMKFSQLWMKKPPNWVQFSTKLVSFSLESLFYIGYPCGIKSMVDEPQLNQLLMDGISHCDLVVDVEHSTSAMKIKFNIRFYGKVDRLVNKHFKIEKRSNCDTLFFWFCSSMNICNICLIVAFFFFEVNFLCIKF